MNKYWRFAAAALTLVLSVSLVACNGDDDEPAPALSEANDIIDFTFAETTPVVTATITGTEITANFPFGTDVTALVPTVTVSADATVDPASGVAQDFTNPVTYTVTAENGDTQAYTVTVTTDPGSDAKELTNFALDNVDGETVTVDGFNISVVVPFSTDVTTLVPTFDLSADATSDPASGATVDFSSPVTITVTAQDGTTQAYTVTVTPVATSIEVVTEWFQDAQVTGTAANDIFAANSNAHISVHGTTLYIHDNNDAVEIGNLADGTVDAGARLNGKQLRDDPTSGVTTANEINFLKGIMADDAGNLVGVPWTFGQEASYPVYSWAGGAGDQQLLYDFVKLSGVSLGFDIEVQGDITGNAVIYLPVVSQSKVVKMVIEGGAVTSATEVSLGDYTMGSAPNISAVSDAVNSDFYVVSTGTPITRFQADGTKVGEVLPNDFNASANKEFMDNDNFYGFSYIDTGDRQLIAAIDQSLQGSPANAHQVMFIDITGGAANVTSGNIVKVAMGTPIASFEGKSDVDFIVNGDGTVTVVALVPNVGYGHYTVSFQ